MISYHWKTTMCVVNNSFIKHLVLEYSLMNYVDFSLGGCRYYLLSLQDVYNLACETN